MRNNIDIRPFETKIAFLVGLLLFVYLALRAIYSPILHDEIATFYYYIQSGVIFPPEAHWDANNHLLNSLLSHWSYRLFGSEPWALRLPNVLSFILFCWSSWKIATFLHSSFIRWGFFLALNMAHYMFEYFGETRGYGMSMALLLFGLFMLIRFLKDGRYVHYFLIISAFVLATSANLTLIYSTLLVFALITWRVFQLKLIVQKRLGYLITLFVGFAILYPFIRFAFDLKERGALYYGGKTGFWEYTGGTLATLYLGHFSIWIEVLLHLLFVTLVAAFVYHYIKNKPTFFDWFNTPSFVFVYFFVGSLAAIFATRFLLDVNYPEDRAAMYLFPYFISSMAFVFDLYWTEKKLLVVAFSAPLFFFPVQFLSRININSASFSMEERAPLAFYNYIQNQPRNAKYPTSVGGYVTQELCWFYMNHQHGGNEGRLMYSNHIDTLSDFQIVNVKRQLPEGFPAIYKKVNDEPVNELNLYERRNRLTLIPVWLNEDITNWHHNTDEYFEFMSYNVPDSLKNKTVYIGLETVIDALASPFNASLVVSQKRADFSEISQERFKLDWLKKEWKNDGEKLTQGFLIPEIHSEAKYLVLYLWNQNQVSFLTHSGIVELFLMQSTQKGK